MNEHQEEILTAEQGGEQGKPTEKGLMNGPAEGAGKAAEDSSADARIFTQQDVDHIVRQRLATEKARSAALLQQKEQELRVRELGYQARDALAARGLPVELMQVLDYTDEAAFTAALERLDEVMARRLSETVDDRLRGAAPKVGNGSAGADVRSAFGLDKGR